MQISSLQSTIIVTDNLQKDLSAVTKKYSKSNFFILVDENTQQHCLPIIADFERIKDAKIIEIKSGEDNKSLESAKQVWSFLSNNGADRNSLLINLGGGVIGDLGGFAASTFKRGIDFINIPTTLLAQVDASIGGKLGINFDGFKNEIGLFKSPAYVVIDTVFLKSLDRDIFLSGFAEMIKHALIYSSNHWKKLKTIDFSKSIDYEDFKKSIAKSIFIKNDFIQDDPKEKNIRKALNFGHTIGHALESFFLERNQPMLHGHAIAHGMVCELILSHLKLGFDKLKFEEIANFVLKTFGRITFEKDDFETIYKFMLHDKKNEKGQINFTLLSEIGEVELNVNCKKDLIFNTLDFYTQVQ